MKKRLLWITALSCVVVAVTIAVVQREFLYEAWLLSSIDDLDSDDWESTVDELARIGGDRTAIYLAAEFLSLVGHEEPETAVWPDSGHGVVRTPEHDFFATWKSEVPGFARAIVCQEALATMGERSYSSLTTVLESDTVTHRLWAILLLSSAVHGHLNRAFLGSTPDSEQRKRLELIREGWLDPPPLTQGTKRALRAVDRALELERFDTQQFELARKHARCALYLFPYLRRITTETVLNRPRVGHFVRIELTGIHPLASAEVIESLIEQIRREHETSTHYGTQHFGTLLKRIDEHKVRLSSISIRSELTPDLHAEIQARSKEQFALREKIHEALLDQFLGLTSGSQVEAMFEVRNLTNISERSARRLIESLPKLADEHELLRTAARLVGDSPPRIAPEATRALLEFAETDSKRLLHQLRLDRRLAQLGAKSPEVIDLILSTIFSTKTAVPATCRSALITLAGTEPAAIFASLRAHEGKNRTALLQALSAALTPYTLPDRPPQFATQIGDGIPQLEEIVNSSTNELRELAAGVITRAHAVDKTAAKITKSWFESDEPDLRRIAVQSSFDPGLLKTPPLAKLRPFLDDPDVHVRATAFSAFTKLRVEDEAARKRIETVVRAGLGEEESTAIVEALLWCQEQFGMILPAPGEDLTWKETYMGGIAKALHESPASMKVEASALDLLVRAFARRPDLILPYLRTVLEKAPTEKRAAIEATILRLETKD